MDLLNIENLHARVDTPDGQEILKGLNLTIKKVRFTLLWVLMELVNQHLLRY